MKPVVIPAIIFLFTFQYAFAQNYWQQKVDYEIAVTLDEVSHSINAAATIRYRNNSPDTLNYLWFHIWPNAYSHDGTAYSHHEVKNGNTKFYFSEEKDKGYINRLQFRTNDVLMQTEDHHQHNDIIKLLLNKALAPGETIIINTPFHLKFPAVFSRSGYLNGTYLAAQWYPKPAVYDRKGWHTMPYLDQGEFYSEFGDYKVSISVPDSFRVYASGKLQPGSTYTYTANNIHDFAWVATKNYAVAEDTMILDGKNISIIAAYKEENADLWSGAVEQTKTAIREMSELLGNYPYESMTVIDHPGNAPGGMEYPGLTIISAAGDKKLLNDVIRHETGHNWFYGILATNERDHPWMDEGMNSYYDRRLDKETIPATSGIYSSANEGKGKKQPAGFINSRLPNDWEILGLRAIIAAHIDQPIETTAPDFSPVNYGLIAYTKTALWLQDIEKYLGRARFDSMMKEYYNTWKFRHPYPEDFIAILEKYGAGEYVGHLHKTGWYSPQSKKTFKVKSFFSLRDTDKHNYLFIAPAAGYNYYDGIMAGLALHNYTLPISKLRYFISPLYGFSSGSLNGIGRLGYTIFTGKGNARFDIGVSGARFNVDEFTDSSGRKNYMPFHKIVPFVKYNFNQHPRSTSEISILFRHFNITETGINFTRNSAGEINITYPEETRYVNQLKFTVTDKRVLYPYQVDLQADQGKDFVRLGLTTEYFFNYAKGGGMNARLFAGKFFYLGKPEPIDRFFTSRYHLNMTGAKGEEDYTYENYFTGRNEFEGFHNQQIMIRDGGFKIRTDLLAQKIGRTDNWLAAINLTSDVPKNINPLQLMPVKIPLKVFADVGTYAEAWEDNPLTGKILYDAGLQFTVLKIVNIYFPLVYSKEYRDYVKSTVSKKKLLKTMSFSIDIQNLTKLRRLPFNYL